jgi:hypothetical protein
MQGAYAGKRSLHGLRRDAVYTLRCVGGEVAIADVQWADWEAAGDCSPPPEAGTW